MELHNFEYMYILTLYFKLAGTNLLTLVMKINFIKEFFSVLILTISNRNLGWLIVCCFTSCFMNISLIQRHHYCCWMAKFRPILGKNNLSARNDLYYATPAVAQGLGLQSLTYRTALFSRLLPAMCTDDLL